MNSLTPTNQEKQTKQIKQTKQTKQTNKTREFFPTITYTDNFYYIIFIGSLIAWIFLVYIYSIKLLYNNDKGDKKFLPYLFLISLYPIYIFCIAIYEIFMAKTSLIGISPYYPICISTYDMLTPEEKKIGAVSKIDYKCQAKQTRFLADHGLLASKKTEYSIRILFTIIIFLFGFGKINTFQYKLITKNNHFIKILLQSAVIISIFSLTIKIFGQNFGYLSAVFFSFYNSLYHLNTGTIIILIAYLLFNLITHFQ